jgi:Tol biopolymer transport system component
MGAVYRATDTKLNRDVAIKVLPPAFAADAARMARFQREAQVLASLNHPNIAAIYGVEESAIVMELVDGADIAGPVPIPTAIDYARQIAVGLEAAHEKGIVHRDLKPANIKVTPEGVVKLLDFGLAKAGDDAGAAGSSTAATMSPTLSLAMTQAGVILGTAAYMSPEQARGKSVDKRADIWAFGVVLFELLTGKAIFAGGETVSDSLAAVILKDPDWSALPADTPPRVRRLIRQCLQKDPKQRLRDIGDARLALEEPEVNEAAAAPMPAASSRIQWLPWSLAVLALLAAGAAWLPRKAADPGFGVARFPIVLPENLQPGGGPNATGAVPSPDGRHIALVLRNGGAPSSVLGLRSLDNPAVHLLEKTESAALPFWSPDSQNIAFFVENRLMRVPLSGGTPVRVCDTPEPTGRQRVPGDGGAWNQDGVILFGLNPQGPIHRVPASGGKAVPVTTLQKGESNHAWPQFLPDGRHFLYLARNSDRQNTAIYVQELGSSQRVLILKNTTRAVWAPPGYLLYVRENTLYAQHMGAKTFQLSGEPQMVEQDVRFNEPVGRSSFSVSQNGVMAFLPGVTSGLRQLVWFDRQGKRLSTVGEQREFLTISLSPDGQRVASVVGRRGASDVWVMDLSTGVLARMTSDGNIQAVAPVWSPDSQSLVASPAGGGLIRIDVASGKNTVLSKEPLVVNTWTPDGRSLICTNPEGNRLFSVSLESGAKPQTLLATPHRQIGYRLSPDGKYVAYASYETGAEDIYVASFPSFAVKRRVSAESGSQAEWTRNGKEVVFRTETGKAMSAEIQTVPTLSAASPQTMFMWPNSSARPTRFGVSADGQRFLINDTVVDVKEKPEFMVVLNWFAGLR